MIRIINDSSERQKVCVTYVITLNNHAGDADLLRADIETNLGVVGWSPYLDLFTELMYRWNGLWKYRLRHYVEIEYPTEHDLCSSLRFFWDKQILAHQNIEDIELCAVRKAV